MEMGVGVGVGMRNLRRRNSILNAAQQDPSIRLLLPRRLPTIPAPVLSGAGTSSGARAFLTTDQIGLLGRLAALGVPAPALGGLVDSMVVGSSSPGAGTADSPGGAVGAQRGDVASGLSVRSGASGVSDVPLLSPGESDGADELYREVVAANLHEPPPSYSSHSQGRGLFQE